MPNTAIINWIKKKNYKQLGTVLNILLINILRLKIIYVALLASIHKITHFGTLFSAHKKKESKITFVYINASLCFVTYFVKLSFINTHLHLIYVYIINEMFKRVFDENAFFCFHLVWFEQVFYLTKKKECFSININHIMWTKYSILLNVLYTAVYM